MDIRLLLSSDKSVLWKRIMGVDLGMQKRNLFSFFIAALLLFQSIGYVSPSWVSLSVPSQGLVDYYQNNQVKVYDFRRYSGIAPCWRVRLSDSVGMNFSLAGLNFSIGWGALYLHETIGNTSAFIELTSRDALYGVGFIGVNGDSWRLQWHDNKLWLYYALDEYGLGSYENQVFSANAPVKLGIEYVNPTTIGFYAKFANNSFARSIITSVQVSEPAYVQLFFSGRTACFSKLLVAQTLNQILNSVNGVIVEDSSWFPYLNLTAPRSLQYFGILAQIPNQHGEILSGDNEMLRELEFLKEYGFKAIKLLLNWEVLMPSIGTFNETELSWATNFTRLMNSQGFHVLLTMQSYELSYLTSCNQTYERNDEWLNHVMSNDTLRSSFVQTWIRIVQRVKDLDVSYELLNEPDPAESLGRAGFEKLIRFTEDLGKAIRNQDLRHMIFVNIYQWQDKHSLWATLNVHFNFTNYGFSLHVYPTDTTWQLPNLGYDSSMITWLKSNRFPVIVSEVPMTALDPWIDEKVLIDPGTWSQAWRNTMNFILGFSELTSVTFLRYMVTVPDSYSNLDVAKWLFDAFSDQIFSN